MKLYLVENYTPDLKFDNNSLIIGLTPLSCYQLGKAGVDYKIWEDYVDVSGFTIQYSEYYREQNLWLKEFDEFLIEIFPQAASIKLPLASTYHFYLRNIIDSLVLRAKELQLLFKRVNPEEVLYVSQSPKKDIIDFNLLFRGNIESLFFRLAPLICKKNNIPFSRVQIFPGVEPKKDKKSLIKRLPNIQDIKNFVSGKKFLSGLWNDIKMIDFFRRTMKISHLEKLPKANILFLEQNSYLRKIMAEAIKGGYKVYYRFDNSIIRQYCGFHSTKCRIDNKKKIEFTPDLELVSKKLKKDTNLINWFNRVCGINVGSIILPRLLYFIKVISPKIIFWTREYTKVYDNLGIRFVFLTHGGTPADYSAIAASRYSKKTRVAYIYHGDEIFDTQEFIDSYVSPYDMFLVSNDELAEYLRGRKNRGNFNTDILQSPIRYALLPLKNSVKPKTNKNRPRVIFVPTMYLWDNKFWVILWPDTWYFHWHKQLLEFFSERDDFEFIWKAIPASNETYDPILDIIKEKKYPNIRYETSPFISWISKADRVLLDYPSTALYEASFCRLPVMSLYFEPFRKVRKTAVEMFGKSVQSFSNFSEGIQKVSDFLDTEASQFIVNIPHSKQPFINLLNSIYYSEKDEK